MIILNNIFYTMFLKVLNKNKNILINVSKSYSNKTNVVHKLKFHSIHD